MRKTSHAYGLGTLYVQSETPASAFKKVTQRLHAHKRVVFAHFVGSFDYIDVKELYTQCQCFHDTYIEVLLAFLCLVNKAAIPTIPKGPNT